MNDGYTTDELFFTAALCYIFGTDALTKIELIESRDARSRHQVRQFTLDVPSLDAAEYYKEFKAGMLAIADLFSFGIVYTGVTKTLRDMTRRGDTEWVSPSWIAGRRG